MKKHIYVLILVALTSCAKPNLKDDFDCGSISFDNLESVTDYKNNFTMSLPKGWETEFNNDEVKSSIVIKDITKKLKNTTIIEASFMKVHKRLNSKFVEAIKNDILKMKRVELKSKLTSYNGMKTYYNLSQAKNDKYTCSIFNVFMVEMGGSMLHVEAMIFGTENVDERICKVISAINSIKFID